MAAAYSDNGAGQCRWRRYHEAALAQNTERASPALALTTLESGRQSLRRSHRCDRQCNEEKFALGQQAHKWSLTT